MIQHSAGKRSLDTITVMWGGNTIRAASWSRRAFLTAAAACGALGEAPTGKGVVLSSEARRYFDPATEFPILRLTQPTYSSYLAAEHHRSLGRNFVLFSSDRQGKPDVYRMDLHNNEWRRLTDAEALDIKSAALGSGDRAFYFIDGASLRSSTMSNLRERDVYSATAPYETLADFALTADGSHAYVVERRAGGSRIRLVPLGRGGATSDVVESTDEMSAPLPRPGSAGGLAYRCGDGVSVIERGKPSRDAALAPGRTGSIYWSPDGTSLIYLSIPETKRELNSIREYLLATGQDRLIARTSQFVRFAPNADASVFVGASGSKASPHVLILLRNPKREMTLCEHRAQNAANLEVAFAPNSQRVLYQSDAHGKPALYSVAVERFVAETES
jgi:oligogalacturonide lyase